MATGALRSALSGTEINCESSPQSVQCWAIAAESAIYEDLQGLVMGLSAPNHPRRKDAKAAWQALSLALKWSADDSTA